MASGRQPWRTAEELAHAHAVPYDTFQKHAARWRKELDAEIIDAKRARGAAIDANRRDPLLASRTAPLGDQSGARLKAEASSGPPGLAAPGQALGLDTETLRGTRQQLVDAVGEGVQGLLEEVRRGKGSARVTAINQLFDRAGLLKASENKTEETPYEGMDDEELRARASYLFTKVVPSGSEGALS